MQQSRDISKVSLNVTIAPSANANRAEISATRSTKSLRRRTMSRLKYSVRIVARATASATEILLARKSFLALEAVFDTDVRVRSRDVSPSWAVCAVELADVAVLLVCVALARFDALVDVTWRAQRPQADRMRCFGPTRAGSCPVAWCVRLAYRKRGTILLAQATSNTRRCGGLVPDE